MKAMRSAVLAVSTVLCLTAAAHAADGTFDKTLKVKGPVLLSVHTGAGNIHVSPGPVDAVHIVGHVHGSGSSAEDRVRQVANKPPITQTGNIISIGHNFQMHNISIDYDITTPRGTDLSANSGSGNLVVQDEGGPVQLKTGSGDVSGSGLSGHVSLETGSGTIKAGMLSAMDVKAQTGSGSITLTNVQSGLWAHSGSGSLDIAGKPVNAWRVETGSGNVTLDTHGAPLSLNATTGSGEIEYTGGTLKQTQTTGKQHVVGEANGGGPKVRVMTGSGDIHIQ